MVKILRSEVYQKDITHIANGTGKLLQFSFTEREDKEKEMSAVDSAGDPRSRRVFLKLFC